MKQTVLITGATSGFGYEFAKLFAKDASDLILVARNEDSLTSVAKELQTTYKVSVRTIAVDLSEPKAAKVIFDKLTRTKTDIDVLINNAGFGKYGDFADIMWNEHEKLVYLNIVALTHLTRLFLPGMIARRSGKILNVASTAAFQPGPHMAVYFASKSYVLSLSEALHEEVKGTGVHVTALCPGPTKTNFAKRAKTNELKLYKYVDTMTPTEVAKKGYNALQKNKQFVIPGIKNAFFAFSTRLFPRKMVVRSSRKLMETE